jgi:hypothetical protein
MIYGNRPSCYSSLGVNQSVPGSPAQTFFSEKVFGTVLRSRIRSRMPPIMELAVRNILEN